MSHQDKKPQIDYPCVWDYKVIGEDHALIPQNIEIILENFEFSHRKANKSASGKYTSFYVSVRVSSEMERNHIFGMLQKIPTVKIVI
jgi:putative lipoic acid-binding regulatory protein